MLTVMASAWVPVVGWALVHFVWQGALVHAVAGLTLRCVPARHSQARYSIAVTALILMFAAPIVTVMRTAPSLAGAAPVAAVANVTALDAATSPAESRASAVGAAASPTPDVAARAASGVGGVLRSVTAGSLVPLLPLVVTVWLLGVALFLLRLAGGLVLVHQWRTRQASRVSREVADVASAVAARVGLRASVEVLQSTSAVVPMVIGVLRPAVLLPVSAVTGLSPRQLEMLLAHEFAHIKRLDPVVNLFQNVVEAVLFYHPSVWMVSSVIRREREYCCDDVAAASDADRLLYASTLAHLAAFQHQHVALGVAGTGGLLHERIRRTLRASSGAPASQGLAFALSALSVAMLIGLASALASDDPVHVELSGAGTTFPAPLITSMADTYRDVTEGRVTINYQTTSFGGGIRQFIEESVMFGVSGAFLNEEQLAAIAAAGGGVAFHLPIARGDVVITYNVPGVETGLVFDGETIAEIFYGNITTWADPQIALLNPGVPLPPLPITVVHRVDDSGTTNIFSDYLTKVSRAWSEWIGFGTSVPFPTGIGVSRNDGVAGVVQDTPGAIGYNSAASAVLNDITYGYVVNKSGNVIEPNRVATSVAADVPLPADARIMVTDTEALDGYPITGFAWILLYENLEANDAISTREEAEELLKFVLWAITDGQDLAEPLSFSRIPDTVLELNLEMIRQMKWEGEDLGAQVLAEAGL